MPDITGAQATPIPKKKYWKPRKLHQVCMGDCSPPWNSANQHVTKVTPTRRFFDKSVKCEILKIVKPHENEKCTSQKHMFWNTVNIILLCKSHCERRFHGGHEHICYGICLVAFHKRKTYCEKAMRASSLNLGLCWFRSQTHCERMLHGNIKTQVWGGA